MGGDALFSCETENINLYLTRVHRRHHVDAIAFGIGVDSEAASLVSNRGRGNGRCDGVRNLNLVYASMHSPRLRTGDNQFEITDIDGRVHLQIIRFRVGTATILIDEVPRLVVVASIYFNGFLVARSAPAEIELEAIHRLCLEHVDNEPMR